MIVIHENYYSSINDILLIFDNDCCIQYYLWYIEAILTDNAIGYSWPTTTYYYSTDLCLFYDTNYTWCLIFFLVLLYNSCGYSIHSIDRYGDDIVVMIYCSHYLLLFRCIHLVLTGIRPMLTMLCLLMHSVACDVPFLFYDFTMEVLY